MTVEVAATPEWLKAPPSLADCSSVTLVTADTIDRFLDQQADCYGVASLVLQLQRGETTALPGHTRLVTGPAVVRFQRYRDGSTDAELIGLTVDQLLGGKVGP